MARQYVIGSEFGGSGINEETARQFVVPGSGVNDTTSSGTAVAVTVVSGTMRFVGKVPTVETGEEVQPGGPIRRVRTTWTRAGRARLEEARRRAAAAPVVPAIAPAPTQPAIPAVARAAEDSALRLAAAREARAAVLAEQARHAAVLADDEELILMDAA
jgi:hypothetical protein